jgi:hypothetical protein
MDNPNDQSADQSVQVEQAHLFSIRIPATLSQSEVDDLVEALQQFEGLQVIQEETRNITDILSNTYDLIVFAVAAGTVSAGVNAVQHPVKYLRTNAAKIKETATDLKQIFQIWFGKGDTETKAHAEFEPAEQKNQPSKKLKDVTEKDVEDVISNEPANQ